MNRGRHIQHRALGYCLAELMLVVTLLGICLAFGSVSIHTSLRRQEGRARAQSFQAGAAWAQAGSLWVGQDALVRLVGNDLQVRYGGDHRAGGVVSSIPSGQVASNIRRWETEGGVELTFGGVLGSPDSGGSVFFSSTLGAYRVSVRPESGLSTRVWAGR